MKKRIIATLSLSLAAIAVPAHTAEAEEQNYAYTWASMPDFLNTDVCDVTQVGTYTNGPKETNASYETGINYVLNTVHNEGVSQVMVAGDLVEGHWGMDSLDTGNFGPVDTNWHKEQALKRAANCNYGDWNKRFANNGLEPLAAVGDHDIGDNPWGYDNGDYPGWKFDHFRLFKDEYADHMRPDSVLSSPPSGTNAARTAYAKYLSPDVLLVTVDVFVKSDKDVAARLDSAQLNWLDNVLGQAEAKGTKWIIVQGHVPVVKPVRMNASSGLTYEDGRASQFWQIMKAHHVDAYFAGEVHAISAHYRDGIAQITHGGIFPGFVNYLLCHESADGSTLTIEAKSFSFNGSSGIDNPPYLWQTDVKKRKPIHVEVQGPTTVGTVTLTSDNQVVSTSGLLDEYYGRQSHPSSRLLAD